MISAGRLPLTQQGGHLAHVRINVLQEELVPSTKVV
jgi:hypothetical protein